MSGGLTHFVYFIGGPQDLTKRAYPGRSPNTAHIEFPMLERLDMRQPPAPDEAVCFRRALYRVCYGNETFGDNRDFYIAVYDGTR